MPGLGKLYYTYYKVNGSQDLSAPNLEGLQLTGHLECNSYISIYSGITCHFYALEINGTLWRGNSWRFSTKGGRFCFLFCCSCVKWPFKNQYLEAIKGSKRISPLWHVLPFPNSTLILPATAPAPCTAVTWVPLLVVYFPICQGWRQGHCMEGEGVRMGEGRIRLHSGTSP